jgi:hypothetical protein
MNGPTLATDPMPTALAARGSARAWSVRRWFGIGCVLLAIQVSPFWWSPTSDAVGYLSIARNLAHGRLENQGKPQLFFAPGYPLLISAAFVINDRPFLIISLIHLLLGMALMTGVYRWVRRIDLAAALPVTMLVMANVSVWEFYRATLSEFAFMTALVWGAYALDMTVESSQSARPRWLFAGIALAGMAALTRQTGGVLAAGFFVALALAVARKQWRWPGALVSAGLVGCAGAGAVLATMYYDRLHATPGARTYVDFLRDSRVSFAAQLWEGLRLRVFDTGRLIVPGMFGAYNKRHSWIDINTVVYVPLFVGLTVGWWRRLRVGGSSVLSLGWIVYLLFYMVWPFDQGPRFLMPMLPVLCLAVWDLVTMFAKAGMRVRKFVVILAGAHLAISLGFWLSTYPRTIRTNRQWAPLASLAETIRLDRQPTATFLPHGQEYYLAFLLDRRVQQFNPGQAIPAQIRWLVTTETEPAPIGFVIRKTAGTCRLWEPVPDHSASMKPE